LTTSRDGELTIKNNFF